MSDFVPLVFFKRKGVTEITIHGALCVYSQGRIVESVGADVLLYGRSLTKPYQIKPIALDLQDLPPEAQAISLSSHSAESFHLAALEHMVSAASLQGFDLRLDELQLPEPRKNHPCSGKHAAILLASQIRGWSSKMPPELTRTTQSGNYISKEHPYFHAYLESLRAVLGRSWQPQHVAIDGCGLPTLSFRLSELALIYEALSRRRSDDWIWSAMVGHPELIGGTNRFDTAIMKVNAERVLAKEGADGLLGLAFEAKGQSYGVVIKIAHGYDAKAAAVLANVILIRYGLNPVSIQAPHGQSIVVAQF